MMETKALAWNQVDKTQIPLERLIEEYLLVCRSEGKSPKTLRGYREKLGRFCRWLDGNLGDFTDLPPVIIPLVRLELLSLAWAGRPRQPGEP